MYFVPEQPVCSMRSLEYLHAALFDKGDMLCSGTLRETTLQPAPVKHGSQRMTENNYEHSDGSTRSSDEIACISHATTDYLTKTYLFENVFNN